MKKIVNFQYSLMILLLLLIFTGNACTKSQNQAITTPVNTTPTDTTTNTPGVKEYKYLALGDSYTIGQNVDPTGRFPAQTVGMLSADKIKVSTVQYIATSGWTTANLQSAIAQVNPKSDFDIVTLLIGVNDQYQHVDTATYRVRFTQLLKQSVNFANNLRKRVFVLSIPDYSATPFVPDFDKARVSKEIDWFNAINKEVTLANDIAYIDITPYSRQAKNDPSLIAKDSLHPSEKQYMGWAQMLVPYIKQVLK